jgi:DNA-binding response OmpR family regulator
LGARVSRVIDGYEVLQKMNEDRPDLIILDCQLPRLDGRSTLKSLMQDTSAVPVIAISGLELQDPVLDEMIVLGAAGVMEKPLDPTSLNKTLNEIFRM